MHFLDRSGNSVCPSTTFNIKSITFNLLSVLIVLVSFCEIGGAATPGALDLTFGNQGVTRLDFNSSSNYEETRDIAVQADGKIVMVGYKGNGFNVQFDFLVVRYNADGTLDNSFGTNGVVATDFNNELDVANSVAIQPDGKILVAGYTENIGSNPTAFKIARYLPNGTLDTAFGTSGKVYSGFLEYAVRTARMILQPDGKILVAGHDGNPNMLISRFNSDGSIDSDFATGGQIILPDTMAPNAIGLQSNGKIIVAGQAFNNIDSITVYRFNTNGSVDTNFGTNGKFTKTYSINTTWFGVYDARLAIQPDDKIIVSGTFAGGGMGEFDRTLPPLLRLTPNGSLDPDFVPNSGNVSTAECGLCTSMGKEILPLADGRFYLVGFSGDYQSIFRGISISRYNANGTFDNSFGYYGTRYIRKVDFTHSAQAAALQPDGKIVIGATGSTTRYESNNIHYDYLLVRLHANATPQPERGDFDGDGKTDFAVFRPSNRFWYIQNSSDNSFSYDFFGVSTDIIVPGDYNYDGKTDLAAYRPGTATAAAYWWVKSSQPGGGNYSTGLGAVGDIPVPADYDGDGLMDAAVFRPSNGMWSLKFSSISLQGAYIVNVPFGLSGDKPVPGDYDGDNLADVAIFRPSTGTWWIRRSTNPGNYLAVQFGLNGDRPVQADYDGDNKTDIAVYRNGVWYVLKSSNGSVEILNWGLSDDTPVPGDYDGDNKTDIAVWRASDGNWYVIKSSDASYLIYHWGTNGDVPIPAKYLP